MQLIRWSQADLPGNILSRARIIPRDHDHADPRRVAFLNSRWNFRANGVGQAQQADEVKPKIVLLRW